MRQRYQLLTTVPGIGAVSALTILSELILLAPAMTVRQWVASSGLDPAHQQSGTSLNKPSRISRAGNRRLRASLYMSALSASRYDRHLAAFYQALRARHKTGLQALTAVVSQDAACHLRHLQNRYALRWETTVSEYPGRGRIKRRVKRKQALLGSNHAEG